MMWVTVIALQENARTSRVLPKVHKGFAVSVQCVKGIANISDDDHRADNFLPYWSS